MWIANTSWNAATWFPSLGYSYQLGLNSSHWASGICEVAVRHLGRKGSPRTEPWQEVPSVLRHKSKNSTLSKEDGMNCALEVPSPPLSSQSMASNWISETAKLGEVTRPFPRVPRGELKVLKQLRFFDSSVYPDSMTQLLDVSLDLWYQL